MKRCVLCGATDKSVTREHVIPQWARRSFDIQGPVTVDMRDEPGELHQRIGTIQHLNITLDRNLPRLQQRVAQPPGTPGAAVPGPDGRFRQADDART
jgi:hypothetical protein